MNFARILTISTCSVRDRRNDNGKLKHLANSACFAKRLSGVQLNLVKQAGTINGKFPCTFQNVAFHFVVRFVEGDGDGAPC